MRKNRRLTLEDHLAIADDLAIVEIHLRKVVHKLQPVLFKNDPIINYFIQFITTGTKYTTIKGRLDDLYIGNCTPEEVEQHGYIYYNAEQRYFDALKRTISKNVKQLLNPS
jgi:hypothetical protein